MQGTLYTCDYLQFLERWRKIQGEKKGHKISFRPRPEQCLSALACEVGDFLNLWLPSQSYVLVLEFIASDNHESNCVELHATPLVKLNLFLGHILFLRTVSFLALCQLLGRIPNTCSPLSDKACKCNYLHLDKCPDPEEGIEIL